MSTTTNPEEIIDALGAGGTEEAVELLTEKREEFERVGWQSNADRIASQLEALDADPDRSSESESEGTTRDWGDNRLERLLPGGASMVNRPGDGRNTERLESDGPALEDGS